MNKQLKKILIVEDDKDFSWLLEQAFAGTGFSMAFAKDGQEGFDMAQKEHPDLMMIDINLPIMDGITMAKKIKEAGIETKMIFLTNLSDQGHVSEAIDISLGADYIVKSDMRISNIVARAKEKLAAR